jgi:hypothetical protein
MKNYNNLNSTSNQNSMNTIETNPKKVEYVNDYLKDQIVFSAKKLAEILRKEFGEPEYGNIT